MKFIEAKSTRWLPVAGGREEGSCLERVELQVLQEEMFWRSVSQKSTELYI